MHADDGSCQWRQESERDPARLNAEDENESASSLGGADDIGEPARQPDIGEEGRGAGKP